MPRHPTPPRAPPRAHGTAGGPQPARLDPPAEPREQGGQQRDSDEHGERRREQPANGHRPQLAERHGEQRCETQRHRQTRQENGATGGSARRDGRLHGVAAGRERLAEPRDGKERVVDPEPQPDHRDEGLDQNGERPPGRQHARGAEGEYDHQHAAHDGRASGDQAAERHQQERHRERQGSPLGHARAGAARLPQVGIEHCLAGPAKLQLREAPDQPAGKRGGGSAKLRHDRVGSSGRRVEPHQDECSAGVAPEQQRVAPIAVATHRRDARDGGDGVADAVSELASRRREGRRPSDHEQRVLRERRPEPRGQLRFNPRRLAPIDACGRLEHALHPHRVGSEDSERSGPAYQNQAAPAHDDVRGTHAPSVGPPHQDGVKAGNSA